MFNAQIAQYVADHLGREEAAYHAVCLWAKEPLRKEQAALPFSNEWWRLCVGRVVDVRS